MTRFAFLLLLPLLGGCSTVSYYSQAIGGHLSLLGDTRPVAEVLADEATDAALAERLRLAQRILDFAYGEMALPDNGSYRDYVDVEQRFVVWNVIAAPRYSVEARTWCYLFVGCVAYRGYFDEQDARDLADELREQEWDVALAGAAAYSTLGWMDDPLLSTMINRRESGLVAVLIHELAHQRVYIKDRTCIAESFASAVAAEGVRRWFAARGDPGAYENYLRDRDLRRAFNRLLLQTRRRLAEFYAGAGGPDELASGKRAIFDRLRQDYRRFAEASGDDRFDRWMARDLNNAHLAQVAAYYSLEPLFSDMIAGAGGDMALFYGQVEELGESPDGLPDCDTG